MTARQLLRIPDYLQHILDAIARATDYIAGMNDASSLEASAVTRDAVVRNLEIIGEAANKIAKADPQLLARHPEIEWVGIRGMRNKIIHDYFEVDYALVWQTVKADLPELQVKIQALLDELNS